jgi:hypothetical protein
MAASSQSERSLFEGSLNHFIRQGEDGPRDGEAEGPGGLEVDHQLELGGLLDKEVGGLGTFSRSWPRRSLAGAYAHQELGWGLPVKTRLPST